MSGFFNNYGGSCCHMCGGNIFEDEEKYTADNPFTRLENKDRKWAMSKCFKRNPETKECEDWNDNPAQDIKKAIDAYFLTNPIHTRRGLKERLNDVYFKGGPDDLLKELKIVAPKPAISYNDISTYTKLQKPYSAEERKNRLAQGEEIPEYLYPTGYKERKAKAEANAEARKEARERAKAEKKEKYKNMTKSDIRQQKKYESLLNLLSNKNLPVSTTTMVYRELMKKEKEKQEKKRKARTRWGDVFRTVRATKKKPQTKRLPLNSFKNLLFKKIKNMRAKKNMIARAVPDLVEQIEEQVIKEAKKTKAKTKAPAKKAQAKNPPLGLPTVKNAGQKTYNAWRQYIIDTYGKFNVWDVLPYEDKKDFLNEFKKDYLLN
jgi:hypothetical protein